VAVTVGFASDFLQISQGPTFRLLRRVSYSPTVFEFVHQIGWRPGIGDASLMGWLTVAAYLLAGISCGWAAFAARSAGEAAGPDWQKWIATTVLLAALGLNKQLDLQSLVTDLGRVLARQQGWYQDRRGVQTLVVLGTFAVSLLTALAVFRQFRKFWLDNLLLGTGIILLATFVVVRAISFHHLDVLLGTRMAGMKANWLLELTGIATIWLAAFRERKPRSHPSGLPVGR